MSFLGTDSRHFWVFAMRTMFWTELISLIVLAGLALFVDPTEATFEGKVIFFAIVMAIIFFIIILDLYNKMEQNKISIRLFDQKIHLRDRISRLEDWRDGFENTK